MSLVYYAYALYDSADLLTYKRNVLDRLRANAVTQGSIPSSTSVVGTFTAGLHFSSVLRL